MNAIVTLCMISLLFLGGCGKKEEKKMKTAGAEYTSDSRSSVKVAKAGDNAYLSEEELMADDSSEFAFVDDEQAGEIEQDIQQLAQDEQASTGQEVAANEGENGAFQAIRFEFNKNAMKPNQQEVLQQDIAVARNAVEQGNKVAVQGHACQMGTPSFNMALSLKRAKAIKDEMVKAGIPEEKVEVMGFGNEMPIVYTDATSREEKIKALEPNRRAEIVVS